MLIFNERLEKIFQRLEKFEIVKVKCLKARNEYLLCVQAANAALHKYFADDLSDLIDVIFNFHFKKIYILKMDELIRQAV